jgi:hypothetical protein
MPNDKVTCPSCGDVHDDLFSDELVALWRKVQKTEDEQTRFELMVKLAGQFVEDISDTDEGVGETLHGLIANVIESRLAFEKNSLALARVLMRSLPHLVTEGDGDEPTTHRTPATKAKAN